MASKAPISHIPHKGQIINGNARRASLRAVSQGIITTRTTHAYSRGLRENAYHIKISKKNHSIYYESTLKKQAISPIDLVAVSLDGRVSDKSIVYMQFITGEKYTLNIYEARHKPDGPLHVRVDTWHSTFAKNDGKIPGLIEGKYSTLDQHPPFITGVLAVKKALIKHCEAKDRRKRDFPSLSLTTTDPGPQLTF